MPRVTLGNKDVTFDITSYQNQSLWTDLGALVVICRRSSQRTPKVFINPPASIPRPWSWRNSIEIWFLTLPCQTDLGALLRIKPKGLETPNRLVKSRVEGLHRERLETFQARSFFSYEGINSRFCNVQNQIPWRTLIWDRYPRISENRYHLELL